VNPIVNRIRIMGLCLIAMLAACAVAATTALAAQPEFRVCAKAAKEGKKYLGKYSNKTCSEESVKGEGKYELDPWTAAKKKTFKSKGGASNLYSYVKGFGVVGQVTCASSKGAGEITGPRESNATLEFSKCTSSGESCASAGAKAGTIRTTTMRKRLLLLHYNTGYVVVAVTSGEPFAEFSCGAEKVKTTGSVVGEVTGDINTVSKTSTESFTVNADDEQAIQEIEEEPEVQHVLVTEVVGVGTFESGIQTSDTVEGEALEIQTEA
jgi:hypothetical protein